MTRPEFDRVVVALRSAAVMHEMPDLREFVDYAAQVVQAASEYRRAILESRKLSNIANGGSSASDVVDARDRLDSLLGLP